VNDLRVALDYKKNGHTYLNRKSILMIIVDFLGKSSQVLGKNIITLPPIGPKHSSQV
jgi:hypothetical protein